MSETLRNVIYIFLKSDDQLFRLYFGDLIQFFIDEVSFVAILFAGATSYSIVIFYILHYLPVDQLKWINIFNAIEGKQSFIQSKIILRKSAKKLIRFASILLNFILICCFLTVIIAGINFNFLSFHKLSFKNFILCSLPWQVLTNLWIYYVMGYTFVGLFMAIICLYYQLRLHQLDFVVNKLMLKGKKRMFNKSIMKFISEYIEIINEIDKFDKFASKQIFVLILNASTVVFQVYNLIFIKMSQNATLGQLTASFDIIFLIAFIILNALRIPNQFEKNKRNLISLMYQKNIQINTKIKVNLILII